MRLIAILSVCCLVAGCAAQEERPDAIADFIRVNQLESVKQIKSLQQLDLTELNDYYVIVSSRSDSYLVAYTTRCTEGPSGRPAPDIRRDPHVLRARVDTLRGCRIDSIYAIDETQVEELRQIRSNPGE